MKKKFLVLASFSFVFFLGKPLLGMQASEGKANKLLAQKVDSLGEKKDTEDLVVSKTFKERISLLSKGLGYGSLNVACTAALYIMLKRAYDEYCCDRVGRVKEELARNGHKETSERYQEIVARVSLANTYKKPFNLIAPLIISAAIVYTNYKHKMLPNAWNFFKQALK